MTIPPRILIVTASHLCRNPRVVKEATTLGAAGYDVTVMSVSTQSRFERIDRQLILGRPFARTVLDYTATDWRTRIGDLTQRGATWVARWLRRSFAVESAQAIGPASALLRRARAFPADLIIVHTELPLWVAQFLIRDGRRVAVDVEDWHSEDLLYADRLSRPLRLLRQAEDFTLNHATYASATSESMADTLAENFRCPRPIVIRNTFPLQPRTRLDRPLGDGPPTFIWFSQTVGPGRGLELFLSAWSQTVTPSLVVLLGDVRPNYRNQLLAGVSAARRDQISMIPPVTPDELPDRLATFDIGLALESRWPVSRDITITNKIFQYMNAGLALIATDTSGQTEVMRAAPGSGLLIAAHETTYLTNQLDHLLTNRERLRECQRASRAAAARQFCWETEAPRLLVAVEQALATPHR